MHKRPTLEDVAFAAGVSKTTVSLTLSGKGINKIPSVTRERVLAAAAKLQFRPHGVARALGRRRADVLGVVCTLNPFVELAHHAFEQSLLSALFYQTLEYGYNPMIYAASPISASKDVLPRYADGRSDAFLLLYPEPAGMLMTCLPEMGMPVIAICRQIDGANWVDSDHTAGIDASLAHLAELGHRRIAYAAPSDVDFASHGRVVAFREGLLRLGLPVREDWIVHCDSEGQSDESGIGRLFSSAENAECPTAVLAWNDFTAGEVYKLIRKEGLRIPEDVSVIGFDDVPAARVASPPLTTVRQDVMLMAKAAVDMAMTALSGTASSEGANCVLCPVNLIIRESTAVPAA